MPLAYANQITDRIDRMRAEVTAGAPTGPAGRGHRTRRALTDQVAVFNDLDVTLLAASAT